MATRHGFRLASVCGIMNKSREETMKEHDMIANEDRPIRSLSTEELFVASMPSVAKPVSMEHLDRLYRREYGLRLVMDDLAYNYWSARYMRSPVERLDSYR